MWGKLCTQLRSVGVYRQPRLRVSGHCPPALCYSDWCPEFRSEVSLTIMIGAGNTYRLPSSLTNESWANQLYSRVGGAIPLLMLPTPRPMQRG